MQKGTFTIWKPSIRKRENSLIWLIWFIHFIWFNYSRSIKTKKMLAFYLLISFKKNYIYLYLYIYIYIYVYISIYLYIYIYIYISIYIYINLSIYLYIYLYLYISIYIYISLSIYIYISYFICFSFASSRVLLGWHYLILLPPVVETVSKTLIISFFNQIVWTQITESLNDGVLIC